MTHLGQVGSSAVNSYFTAMAPGRWRVERKEEEEEEYQDGSWAGTRPGHGHQGRLAFLEILCGFTISSWVPMHPRDCLVQVECSPWIHYVAMFRIKVPIRPRLSDKASIYALLDIVLESGWWWYPIPTATLIII